jgi:hypothetical protein
MPHFKVVVGRLRWEHRTVALEAADAFSAEVKARVAYANGDYDSDDGDWDCGDVVEICAGEEPSCYSPDFDAEETDD